MSSFTDLSVLQDYPDRVPAVLVRELRVRLRRPPFLLTVIIAHGMLLVGMLHALGNEYPFAPWVWVIAILALLLVTVSAAGSLRGEIVRGNFGLLQLAGVEARQLVHGKFAAVMSLTLLTAVSFLPWFVWVGIQTGANLAGHALSFVGLLAVLAVIAAAEIWAATQRLAVAVALVRLALPALAVAPAFLLNADFEFDIQNPDFLSGWLFSLAFAGWLAWLLIDVAAASLDAVARDNLRWQRLVALLLPWTSALAILLCLGAFAPKPTAARANPALAAGLQLMVFHLLLLVSAGFAFLPQLAPRNRRPLRHSLAGAGRWLALPLAPGQAGASLLLISGMLAFLLPTAWLWNQELLDFDAVWSLMGMPIAMLFPSLLLAGGICRLRLRRGPERHAGVLWLFLVGLLLPIAGLLAAVGHAVLAALHLDDRFLELIVTTVGVGGLFWLLAVLAQVRAWRPDQLRYRNALQPVSDDTPPAGLAGANQNQPAEPPEPA